MTQYQWLLRDSATAGSPAIDFGAPGKTWKAPGIREGPPMIALARPAHEIGHFTRSYFAR